MKLKNLLAICLLSICGTIAAKATTTLSATASDTPSSASLTSYSYLFSIGGTGTGVDTVFLGSNDLSPVNVAFKVDGTTTANWSYVAGNTPTDYLEFFSTNGSLLNAGDTLGVTFSSLFAPGSSKFAIAENSTSGATTNEVTPLVGPTSLLTPEPATASLLLMVAALLLTVSKLRRRAA